MKRYFFDLDGGGGWEPDLLGTLLPDDAQARRELIGFAGEMLKGEPHHLDGGTMRIRVRDGAASVCFTLEVALRSD
jgi:hypothetical protein